MRVVTLLPAATEIVAALGAGDRLAGISHECDHPEAVLGLPRVTATPLDASLPSAAIDAAVRRLHEEGRPVIGIDAAQLRRLAPDLVVTQGLCEVCAVADGEAHRLSGTLASPPRVLSLGARTIGGIFEDIGALGRELGREEAAAELVARLSARLERLRGEPPVHRPRVVCIEWLEPLYLAGHWVPELVEIAGGTDVGAEPGGHSARREWPELVALEPDVVVIMLCGFGPARAELELEIGRAHV